MFKSKVMEPEPHNVEVTFKGIIRTSSVCSWGFLRVDWNPFLMADAKLWRWWSSLISSSPLSFIFTRTSLTSCLKVLEYFFDDEPDDDVGDDLSWRSWSVTGWFSISSGDVGLGLWFLLSVMSLFEFSASWKYKDCCSFNRVSYYNAYPHMFLWLS